MLNKYFVAQIAENIFIWPGKKVKTGILDYPSPGEIEIKISRLFFLSPLLFFPTQKVVGNSIVRFFHESGEFICLLTFGRLVSHGRKFACITSTYPLRDYQVCRSRNNMQNWIKISHVDGDFLHAELGSL